MTAQPRYRTLIGSISNVYSAKDETRTERLQAGLEEIVTVIDPQTPTAWGTVCADSKRLLSVWRSKETEPAAMEVINQVTSLLQELSLSAPSSSGQTPVIDPAQIRLYPNEHPPMPSIEFVHRRCPPLDEVFKGVGIMDEENLSDHSSESEMSVEEYQQLSEASSEMEVDEKIVSEVVEEKAAEVEAAMEIIEEEVVEEEMEEEVEEEVVKEIVEEVVKETEMEVVVEEAEEEEEEALEVEPITIRGRKYWLGSDKQIYAIVDDDDVGDAVGEYINGKPQFFAK